QAPNDNYFRASGNNSGDTDGDNSDNNRNNAKKTRLNKCLSRSVDRSEDVTDKDYENNREWQKPCTSGAAGAGGGQTARVRCHFSWC
ncbi:unnamed protein product, partial [Anisakis simplex]|uniref:PTN_MK_C domain-containing protein n=1 Tax=Anisakis simplex TaxID=6269 RepID=A0A0M3JNS4_ANISI